MPFAWFVADDAASKEAIASPEVASLAAKAVRLGNRRQPRPASDSARSSGKPPSQAITGSGPACGFGGTYDTGAGDGRPTHYRRSPNASSL
jgi:hypothetical protein